MYAIIRAGGKQAKVHEGDVLDVERIKDTETVSFTPLLVVGDDGSVVSDRAALDKSSVTAEIIGDSAGPKIDIFKYKNKTGYRRRAGHRQKYTKIKVTAIQTGTANKAAPSKVDKPKAEKAKSEKTKVEADKPKAAKKATKPKADKPKADNEAAKPKAAKKAAAPKAKTADAKTTKAKADKAATEEE
jgi:large subunit ribosomal protein L21